MNFWISILSFIACLVIGRILANSKAFTFLNDRRGRFITLDGLRGFLAISVFYHHFAITYYWKNIGQWGGLTEQYYQNYGKVGVAIFFMITGFLFIYKILEAKGELNWLKLFESRLFRIFPLYIFAILLITFVVLHNSSYQIFSNPYELTKQYARWFLFHGSNINEFTETRRVIAGVEWTLKYEWLFYLSLPILTLLLFKGGKVASILLLLTCLILFINQATFFSFNTAHFILFAIGGITSFLVSNYKVSSEFITSRSCSFLNLFILIGIIFYPQTLSFGHIAMISVFFILVAFGNDLFGILKLKSSILLGEISYSIYLLHGVVLYTLFTQFQVVKINGLDITQYSLLMPLVAILVVLVSSATFLLIEKPFLNYGRKFVLTKALRSFRLHVGKKQ